MTRTTSELSVASATWVRQRRPRSCGVRRGSQYSHSAMAVKMAVKQRRRMYASDRENLVEAGLRSASSFPP
jgi:hypothetical protein